jgi:hypothetical protein
MFLKISKVCFGLAFIAFGACFAALGADAIGEGVRGGSAAPSTDTTAKAA